MPDNATGLPTLLAKPVATLLLIATGIALAFGICFYVQVIPLILGMACFILLTAWARMKTANLLLAYVVADHLCQFLKRGIFMLGPQPMLIYYGFQLLPTLILLAAMASSLYDLRKTKFPLSAKLLALFIAICAAQTFLLPNGSDLVSRFGGANQEIFPLFAAYAAMGFAPSEWRRLAKLFLVLIVISAIYGSAQLLFGPTSIDRAWAFQTGEYSIQGAQVFAYLTGARGDFRPYSYYSAPINWGFFMVLGMLFILALSKRTAIPRWWLRLGTSFTVLGIVSAETRTVWIAALGAFLVHWLLGSRILRSPLVVITGVLVAFGLVLSGGQYALLHWGNTVTSSSLINRYLNVGTISARTSALDIFLKVLPKHVFFGDGYETAGTALESVDETKLQTSDYYSHNAIVGLLLSVGLPGLLAFGLFIYRWCWESLQTVNRSVTGVARCQLWIVVSCVGMLFTGALNGPAFISSSYFAISLGLCMGETIRLRQREEAERAELTLLALRVSAAGRANRRAAVLG